MSDYNPNIPPEKRPFSLQLDVSAFEPATDEEKAQQEVMRESTTFFRDGMRTLFRNPLAVGSMIVLLLLLFTIVVAPLIVPYSYSGMITVDGKRDKSAKNLSPFTYSKLEQEAIDRGESIFPHIFGTDELCRDYFIRVIYGARVSLAVGFFASLIVLIIGLLYGSIAGYAGGRTDLIMMRIVDIIYSLPDTLMVILLSVVLDQLLGQSLQNTVLASIGPNMLSMFSVFGLLYWVGMARLVRGQILSIKNNEYVLAAQAMGAGRMKKTDLIDPSVGLILHVRIGDRVQEDTLLCELFARTEAEADQAEIINLIPVFFYALSTDSSCSVKHCEFQFTVDTNTFTLFTGINLYILIICINLNLFTSIGSNKNSQLIFAIGQTVDSLADSITR